MPLASSASNRTAARMTNHPTTTIIRPRPTQPTRPRVTIASWLTGPTPPGSSSLRKLAVTARMTKNTTDDDRCRRRSRPTSQRPAERSMRLA